MKKKICLVLALIGGITLGAGINAANASVYNGWEKSGADWYYYQSGKMYTGWLYDNGKWYYLNDSGVMQTGWFGYVGEYYYLNESGAMQTGWMKSRRNPYGYLWDGEYWYYLKSDGTLKTGMLIDGNNQYYLGEHGQMLTGWIKNYDSNKWYYAETNGALKEGWLNDGGKWYYLMKNKELASNISVDGYYINENGVWDKSGDGRILVYVGFQNDIERFKIRAINCSDKSASFSDDIKIEKYKDGQWETIASKKDPQLKDISLNSNCSKNIEIDLSEFANKMASGKYRISLKINDQYVSGECEFINYKEPIKINTSKQGYLVGETKEVPFTIVNNSDEKIKYSSDYIVEKAEGPSWKKIKLKKVEDTKYYELNPGEKAEYKFLLSNIDEPIITGVYRISKDIEGSKIAEKFTLSNDDMAVMEAGYKVYNGSTGNWSVNITVENKCDRILKFNKNYRIEALTAEGWKEIYRYDKDSSKESIVLKPGCKYKEKINLNDVDIYDTYRIVKNIEGKEIWGLYEESPIC